MSINPTPHPALMKFIVAAVIINALAIGFLLIKVLQLDATAIEEVPNDAQEQIMEEMRREGKSKMTRSSYNICKVTLG